MSDEIGVAIGVFRFIGGYGLRFAPRETTTATALLVRLAVQAAVVQTHIVFTAPTVLK